MKNAAAVPAIVMLSFFFSSLFAIQVAKFAYKGAPEDLNNKTVRVDGDMVAMAENIYDKTISVRADTASDTPSIFFIIDNSGSMTGDIRTGDNGNDKNGNRFEVTRALLDTLQSNFPNVEVGVAVFGATLWFYQPDRPYFVPLTNQRGCYVPLLQLGKKYQEYGNKTGYEILNSILQTDRGILAYRPPDTSKLGSNTTNITAGFDAAVNAFSSATSINAGRRDKQFIIFFSDGEANTPDSSSNRAETFRFARGINTPTTFTVFFNNSTPPRVPLRIDTMTSNIKGNGYSANNPKSAYWGYRNTTRDSLMDFLMVNVMTVITSTSNGTPKSITIGLSTATNWANGMFTFNKLFPLTGSSTTFNYSITYALYKNSVYLKDTTHLVNNVNVLIDPARALPADSFEVKHWDRDLQFRYGGAAIAVATELMDSIELYFPWKPGEANYNYTAVQIELSTADRPIDRETVTLAKGATFFSGKFRRATSNTRIAGDRVLEHASGATDIITAVFRNKENPVLPLDTLRLTLPLNIARQHRADSAVTRDTDGNGYIDRIDLYLDSSLALTSAYAKNFTVKYGGTNFTVTAVVQDQTNGRLYHLTVTEKTGTGFQTSWLPTVQAALPGTEGINLTCKDGCAPVVARVVKYISSDKRVNDTVKVFFSEKIQNAGGGVFSIVNQPVSAFQVWWSVNGSSFSSDADSLLGGIKGFVSVENDSVLVFNMANGKDLTASNWLNIKSKNRLLSDRAGNVPQEPNRKAQVEIVVKRSPVVATVSSLNPPTTNHVSSGPLLLENEYLVRTGRRFDPHSSQFVRWVGNENAGTVISLTGLVIPSIDSTGIREPVPVTIKIYDVVGNCVNWLSQPDLFVNMNGPIAREINFYWNELNYNGMRVAPGVYRASIYIHYPASSKIGVVKLNKNIGIHP